MKTHNKNQNTPKTEPSADDKALADLVRTKVLDFVHGMKKLCNDNNLSFGISGWVEDPVDRGDTPEKTHAFNCENGKVCTILIHQIINISLMLKYCAEKCSYNEVANLCTMAENLIGHVCKQVMTYINKKMETKEK